MDVQPIHCDPGGELTAERAAAYIAKYATKSAEDLGLGDRRLTRQSGRVTAHITRLVRTCWALADLYDYTGIRKWIHLTGARGHDPLER